MKIQEHLKKQFDLNFDSDITKFNEPAELVTTKLLSDNEDLSKWIKLCCDAVSKRAITFFKENNVQDYNFFRNENSLYIPENGLPVEIELNGNEIKVTLRYYKK